MIIRKAVDEKGRLLLTCFEPFGGSERNMSQDVVMAMPDRVGQYEIHKLCLPTVFKRAADTAIEAAERLRPEAILSVGEAAGRAAITPEMIAVNLQYARIPYNLGQTPRDIPVVEGGENALFSTLPVRGMVRAICDAGLPGEVSYSAGAYVCNDLMYRILHHFRGTGILCGFVHVPAGDELRRDELILGLTAAIKSVS